MGHQYSCLDYGGDGPAARTPTAPKNQKERKSRPRKKRRTNVGFYEGALVQTTRKIRVRMNKRGQPVELRKNMELRIKRLYKGDDGKPIKLEVTADELDSKVTLKARVFRFLNVVDDENAQSEDEIEAEDVAFPLNTKERDRPLSDIGWYEVLKSTPILDSDDDDDLSKGDIIRITDVRSTGTGADGQLIGLKKWVRIYDSRNEYLTFLDEDRILGYTFDDARKSDWGMATNFPIKGGHRSNQWEVTRIDPEGQGKERGVSPGWKVVGVDKMTTTLNPRGVEDTLIDGRDCIIYFDTKHEITQRPGGSFLSVNLDLPGSQPTVSPEATQSIRSVSSLRPTKVKKPPRTCRIHHWLCGFAGFALIGLLVTVLILLEVYAFQHFDRHDGCSDFPIILMIWTLFVLIMFITAIPAGCEGELDGSCAVGCTEWYAKGTWCSVLFSIWALVQFFTMKDSCKASIQERNSTWVAYQIFIWTQVGLGGCALFFTLAHFLTREPKAPETEEIELGDMQNSQNVEVKISPAVENV